MNRTAGLMAMCLGLGAAVMYGGSNFRLRLEPVAAPPAPLVTEPGRLPESVTGAPRFDPNVRQAQLLADDAATKSEIESVSDQVAGQAVKWLVSQSPRLKVAGDTVTVRLKDKPPAGQTANIFINDALVKVADQGARGIDYTAEAQEFTIALNKVAPGAFKLGVKIDAKDAATAPTSSISVARALVPPATNVDLVTVSSFQNSGPAADAGQFEPYPPAQTAIDVFGGYLRLRGRADVPGPTLAFFKLVGGTLFPVKAADLRSGGGLTADWDSELELLQDPPGTPLSLIIRADGPTGFTFAKKVVTYNPRAGLRPDRRTFGDDPVPPAKKDDRPDPRSDAPVFRTNALTLTKVAAGVPAGAQSMLLYVGDGARPVQVKAPAAGARVIEFDPIKLPGDGTHAISVSGATGRDEGPRATLLVRVRTKGPTAAGLSAAGFGSGGGREVLTVQFAGEELKKETVNNTALKLTFKDGSANGKDIGTLDAALPAYVVSANQVSLTYDSRAIVPGEYKLTITNAVQDRFGNALVGPQGLTADDPVVFKVLAATGDALLPSQSAGVFQTGPAVPLAEYLNPRPPVEGFNPSDRVEARVVRLYYYRDAHRVAQLVNRTVKSYGAAAVDIRRRAADRGRDDADRATDERKQLELVAVRAAQDARAAEAELNNLQNGTGVARSQAAGARLEQTQLEQQLDQANRDLERATQLAATQANSDPIVAQQSVNVSNLRFQADDVARRLLVTPGDAALLREQARVAEQLRDAQATLARQQAESQVRVSPAADAARQRVKDLQTEIQKRQLVAKNGDAVEQNNAARIAAAQQALAVKREAEARTLEAWQVKEFEERRRRENQFRVEVAAAKADPDTYGPADPESVDPVLRTSISVIGEGLIQIRGPIKGLNAIRTMVNQIDAPVGQVRISVHTLQVNGERGDRMEKVVANIQRHLDHSRFLTAQSAQLLRYAIASVAARKATEIAGQLPPGSTQWHRDQKYLYAFFGKDFVDELLELDSEFLKTGNKLLSLNSMDTTSLSAGLFVLALAKNDVRAEILHEFMGLVQGRLPEAEWTYYQAGVSDPKCCDACKDKKMYLLANNSRFQSFLGFFNAEIAGPDTLNPLQREFIRLAQIFKARMITEMQLKQRVVERSLLEERVGTHYLQDLQEAFNLEKAAKAELAKLQDQLNATAAGTAVAVTSLQVLLGEVLDQLGIVAGVLSGMEKAPPPADGTAPRVPIQKTAEGWEFKDERFRNALLRSGAFLDEFFYVNEDMFRVYQRVKAHITKATTAPYTLNKAEYTEMTNGLNALFNLIRDQATQLRAQLDEIQNLLRGEQADPVRAVAKYRLLRDRVLEETIRKKGDDQFRIRERTVRIFADANKVFDNLAALSGQYEAAAKKAQNARRPLDEKKLLDLLIDEMEDKFVEILEGTRAHTSNIDNYMKSVTTAIDDDFNTQYYLPSFRRARDASRAWDVTLAQIETTTILTNNRSFGKVAPAASFEFDLPKRKILITEGFQAAKALMDEYGALVNDPSFLALAKMSSGNPVSMMSGGGGGLSAVRNVLPGLPSSADETIMAQAGPGKPKEFGSALESLIPDPAIYKFETGTGFEIRPVLSPDGQAVVFEFDYMYTTDVREPVRADEKHLGRVRRHFIHTDVQLGNFELREVSKYMVAIKVARTGRGVQLLQDIPGVGVLFRPLPSAAASLQQNLIYSQATIFPTLFDLMGLRYAPAVADLDPLADRLAEFAVRGRKLDLEQRIYDGTAARVDEALRIPFGERRMDLYRPQVSIAAQHPNGYVGPGLRLRDGHWVEGYDPRMAYPETRNAPSVSPEGRPKPYVPTAPYPPPFSPEGVPSGPYPSGYPVPPGYPVPAGATPVPPGYPVGASPQPRPGTLPPTGTAANGYRPPVTQPGNQVLPPGYPKPLPPGYPAPQYGSGPPANGSAVREMPATQMSPVVRPAVPPGYPVPRPAPAPQPPALPQPAAAPQPLLPPGYPTPGLPSLPPLPTGVPQPTPTPLPALSAVPNSAPLPPVK